MFEALFRFFVIWTLLCVIASSVLDATKPQIALYIRCIGVMGVVISGVSFVATLIGGNREAILSFMGSIPMILLIILANVSVVFAKKGVFEKYFQKL